MSQRYNDSPKRTKPQDTQLRILKKYAFSVLKITAGQWSLTIVKASVPAKKPYQMVTMTATT